jgi:hypothetical protein
MKRGASAREQSAIRVAQAFLSAASPLLSKVGAALKSGAAFLVLIAPTLFGAEQVKTYEARSPFPLTNTWAAKPSLPCLPTPL